MSDRSINDDKIPVTVLTGFLGAGKTTVLNKILSSPSSGRVAVIVNEFGDAGLDHDLIETMEEDVVLMQSGCLCCSIRGDLSKTIADLLTRRRGGALAFERIVIETTGLADPGPILQTLLVDLFLAQNTRMDGVVTVVDAANGPATLDAQFEAVSQVAMADLILLSKTDLVSSEAAQKIEKRLGALNTTAQIIRTATDTIAPDMLWGLSGLRQGTTPALALVWTTPRDATKADPLSNLSGLAPASSKPLQSAPHDARISSVSIVLEEPLKDEVFNLWLDTLILLKGPDVLRVKGIVFLEGLDAPFVFHGVQHIFNPPVQIKTWSSEDRRSRIVVIARDMTRPEIQHSLSILRAQQPKADAVPSGEFDCGQA